jgi:2-epi-5-epi-valiolone synthase
VCIVEAVETEAGGVYRMQCAMSRSYDVLLSHDVLAASNRTLAGAVGRRRALVVTDTVIDTLHGRQLREYLATLPGPVGVHVAGLSERTKTMATVLAVCDAAQRHGLGRRDPLIAVGGGICTDVVTVAASLIRRGLPYISVPTTLIAQVDAGVGLKGAINFGGSKSYLGCFTAPSAVVVDPGFLRTLPAAEVRAGLAEIVKVALVLDGELFDRLATDGAEFAATAFASPPDAGEDVIVRAIGLMLDQLARNPYEDRSLERLVDFGHTFSGALEERSGHRLRHGEAVAVDIAVTCAIGAELGLLTEADLELVLATLLRIGLPLHSPLCTLDALLAGIAGTLRHRDGALNLVVPTAIGAATVVRTPAEVPPRVLAAALDRVAARAEGTAGALPREAGLAG